jgi:outer membrane protein assembly factor BamB
MATPTEIGGVLQLVAMGHDRVFSVRASDGSHLWSKVLAEPEEPTRAVLPLPDSQLLLSRYTGAILLKIAREGDGFTATEVWRSPRLKNSYSPNVYEEGFLFGFSGQFLLCLDAATGEPRWRQKVNAGSLIRVGRHLVVLGEQSGLVRVVEATPAAYRVVAEATVFNPGALSSTGPSYAGGRLFLRNTEEMVALALESGPAQADAQGAREGR